METQINDEPIQATLEDYEIGLMTDEELEEANKMLETPIFPRNTKVIVVEFNIRPMNANHNVRYEPIAFEDSVEEQNLHYNLITQPDICLMEFDHEGKNPNTQEDVLYDRMIVRSSKPLEYWKNIFK